MRLARAMVVLGLLWPLGAACDDSVPSPRSGGVLGEIAFETTPGKPMELARAGEPAERIVARRDNGHFTLVVTRNVGRSYEAATTVLSEAEFRALEKLIAEHALATWKARPTGDRADDHSSSRGANRS